MPSHCLRKEKCTLGDSIRMVDWVTEITSIGIHLQELPLEQIAVGLRLIAQLVEATLLLFLIMGTLCTFSVVVVRDKLVGRTKSNPLQPIEQTQLKSTFSGRVATG